ncbi:MAG: TolC family protein [Bacteroidota bacterium]
MFIRNLFFLLCLLTSISVWGQSIQDSIPCGLTDIAELMIEKNPIIQRQRYRIFQAQANRQTATSQFDYRLTNELSFGRTESNLFSQDQRAESTNGLLQTNDYVFTSGVERTFRTGLRTGLFMDYARVANNYPFNSFEESRAPFTSENFTTLRMSLAQPLIRGRGIQYAAALETANKTRVEASRLDLTFISSIELLGMVRAYWNYLSTYKRLQIFRENESRVRQVLEITQELVNADRKARNELLQIQADLIDKERQTIAASQFLYDARQNLGRAIGLDVGESTYLGVPYHAFPKTETSGFKEDLDLGKYIELAKQHRADLMSLIKAKEALEIDYKVAQNDMKPQLDLTGSFSYGGTDVGNEARRLITPLGTVPGRNVQALVGLRFQFPVNNNAAKANLLRTQTFLSDQEVVIDNQIRNIELNISIALNDVNNSVIKLEKAYQTLQFSQEVFEAEQIKFQNGLTTLLNLILFQERLTFSQLDYLSAQQEFALAIVNLRNETGTLIKVEDESSWTDLQTFYTLPEVD